MNRGAAKRHGSLLGATGSDGRGLASAFETPERRSKHRGLDDVPATPLDLQAGVGTGRRGRFRRHEQDFLLSVGFGRVRQGKSG